MQITYDMMMDIAGDRIEGANWAQVAAPYGLPWQTIRAAYLRKSAEVYGDPLKRTQAASS